MCTWYMFTYSKISKQSDGLPCTADYSDSLLIIDIYFCLLEAYCKSSHTLHSSVVVLQAPLLGSAALCLGGRVG